MSDNYANDLPHIGGNTFYHNDIFGSSFIVRLIEANLGERVLEVGSGNGHITEQLADRVGSVVALEPNPVLFQELCNRVSELPNVLTYNMTIQAFQKQLSLSASSDKVLQFDSVVYVNVLEHIYDDEYELASARSLLKRDGSVLIVVPAHSWLYSEVDRITGHFRRYSKKKLRSVITRSGLLPVSLRYFDTVGLLPYYFIYKLLGATSTSGPNAFIYSRVLLPLSFTVYKLSFGLIVGKNLVARAVNSNA